MWQSPSLAIPASLLSPRTQHFGSDLPVLHPGTVREFAYHDISIRRQAKISHGASGIMGLGLRVDGRV